MGGTSSTKVIVGVDVVSMGSKLSDFSYALAVLREGSITSYDNVGLSRLIRFLWELRPHIVAVDNVMELGGSRRNLVRILELLPPESKVVQVTLVNGELVDLRRLAREAGVSVEQGRLGPRRTAEVLAILAGMNYGTELKLFDDKVRVVVGRGRVPGSGGSSADRFRRKVRASLLGAVRELKERLEREGIDYDLVIRRGEGGIDGAVFTIYASRERLYGIVRPIRSPNLVVRVRPVVHRKVLGLLYSTTTERYLLVGVDPGIETGLAIIDLDLNPLRIVSSKTLDRDEVIQTVLRYGVPVMIATDKNPPPDMVEKLAAILNVKLYVPSRTLSNAEKESLVGEYVSIYRVSIGSTHERDALASCIKAYRDFEEKFAQLESKLLEIGLPTSRLQKYKAELIRGSTVAEVLESVIGDYFEKEELVGYSKELSRTLRLLASTGGRDRERDRRYVSDMEKVIKERDQLLRRVGELERQLSSLETQLRLRSVELDTELARDREIAELRQRLENVLSYVRDLEARLSEVSGILDELKSNFNLIFRNTHVLVRRLRRLSTEELIKSSSTLGNVGVGELVIVDEFNTLDADSKKAASSLRLRVLTPKQVVPADVMKLYKELGIVVGMCDNSIHVNDYLTLVPKGVIEEMKRLELELKERSESISKLDYEKLLNIISEYRTLRGTEASH